MDRLTYREDGKEKVKLGLMMVQYTTVISRMINNMVKVPSLGLAVKLTSETTRMMNSMARAH